MTHPVALADRYVVLVASRSEKVPPSRLKERVFDALVEVDAADTERVHHAVGRALRAAA